MKKLSYKQYAQYFVVGSFVGILTVIVRHLLASSFPHDTPSYYVLSIIFAYVFGIVVNFILQKMYTFKTAKAEEKKILLIPFAVIALLGSLLTMGLASLLRYHLGFNALFGSFGATVAFIFASVIVSIFNYILNAKIVFKNGEV